jgi:hypothetical protein
MQEASPEANADVVAYSALGVVKELVADFGLIGNALCGVP